MSKLDERLTLAFEELFAANSPYFGGGGPGYYGVHLENVEPDGSELDLVLTFRAGVRYCCCEPRCHFAHYSEDGWARLRECMDRNFLRDRSLPVVRKFRGVIEQGAVFDASDDFESAAAPRAHDAFEYEAGPWLPQ